MKKMIKICAVAGAVMLAVGILTTFAAVSFGGARRLGNGVKNAVHRAMSWADDDWIDDLEDPDYWDELWEDDFWSDEASHSRSRVGTGLVRSRDFRPRPGAAAPGMPEVKTVEILQEPAVRLAEISQAPVVKTPEIPKALLGFSPEARPAAARRRWKSVRTAAGM